MRKGMMALMKQKKSILIAALVVMSPNKVQRIQKSKASEQ